MSSRSRASEFKPISTLWTLREEDEEEASDEHSVQTEAGSSTKADDTVALGQFSLAQSTKSAAPRSESHYWPDWRLL